MNLKRLAALGILLGLFAPQIGLPEKPSNQGKDWLTLLEEKYTSLTSLQMNFKKQTESQYFDHPQTVEGKIYLMPPGRFRLESKDEVIISDGEVAWTYLPAEKQVTKRKVEEGDGFSFLSFLKDTHERFTFVPVGTEKLAEASCQKLKLVPREEGVDWEELVLWVDSKKNIVRKMTMTDLQNNHSTFRFTNIKTDSPLDQKLFKFKAPAKATLIDLTD